MRDVMDARLVWDTWRRILTSDALVDAVVDPPARDPAALGLGPDALAVLAEYASDPVAADVTIGMYRRGLVRNARTALKLVPLARRLVHASGLDETEVVEAFVRSIGYRDEGPRFWRSAAAFVEFLAEHPRLSAPAQRDLLALERAAVALVRRLGQDPPAVWPADAALEPVAVGATDRFVASEAAAVASSDHDLTPWLEDSTGASFARELERSKRYWLIHLPNAAAEHEYAELSDRAARVLTLLAAPRTVVELSALAGLPVADALQVLGSLAELGVVVRREGEGAA
jgi:hypothetical protein